MRCPKCSGQEDRVIDSRASKEGATIRRRRECLSCGYRYTTYEEVERAELVVIKRDGRREPFERKKLVEGIQRACRKRPVPADDVALAVDRILEDLSASFEREVSSEAIGERVMQELRSLDPVAYIRFASIYRQFEEVDDFLQEVRLLASQKRPDKRQLSLALIAEAERRAQKRKEQSL